MPQTFFIADTHFGHAGILIKNCGRPFETVEEMDAFIIKQWKSVVGPTDIVYVLGDFSFHKAERSRQIFYDLPGKKILIQGNHDGDQVRALFRPLVFQEVLLHLVGHRIRLSHYPYTGDHTAEERYPERRPYDRGEWLIHGHVHSFWKTKEKMICVSVENWNFKPVSLSEIQRVIDFYGKN